MLRLRGGAPSLGDVMFSAGLSQFVSPLLAEGWDDVLVLSARSRSSLVELGLSVGMLAGHAETFAHHLHGLPDRVTRASVGCALAPVLSDSVALSIDVFLETFGLSMYAEAIRVNGWASFELLCKRYKEGDVRMLPGHEYKFELILGYCEDILFPKSVDKAREHERLVVLLHPSTADKEQTKDSSTEEEESPTRIPRRRNPPPRRRRRGA